MRYNSETKKNELWEITDLQEKEVNGRLLPCKGKANWKYSQSNFCYYDLEITEIEFNPKK